jgi:hypothetical protein
MFNREIKIIMKDFFTKFFQPAIKNIKENTDQEISESQVSNKLGFFSQKL